MSNYEFKHQNEGSVVKGHRTTGYLSITNVYI